MTASAARPANFGRGSLASRVTLRPMAEPHRWSWHDLADALAAGLERAVAATELEQAVRGLDARSELELHPLLHAALREAGYGVFPEQRFPRERGKRRRSEG